MNLSLCKVFSLLLLTALLGLVPAAGAQELASLYALPGQPHSGDQDEQKSLLSVLGHLESRYQVSFDYDRKMLADKMVKTNRQEEEENVEKALERLLSPFKLEYRRYSDNTYLIYRTPQPTKKEARPQSQSDSREALARLPELKPLQRKMQQMVRRMDTEVRGRVVDGENDEPLPGVNVLVKGTTTGTVTDIDGNYRINVPTGYNTLVFSSVGYETMEQEIGNQNTLNVTLMPDLQSLSEVVVVGYGTQERREVTGAISSVKSEEIDKLAIQSLDQALQGQAPGVVVTQNSGEPGGNVSVRIRGVGSFGNNEPLYVIDGFPVFNDNGRVGSAGFSNNDFNSLAMLNPKDIESIEILKDASAAAIYGSRAANGVVLITTKRGKAGQTKVNFSSDFGFQEAWNIPEFMNAAEFAEVANESYVNAGETPNPEWANPSALGEGTNWPEQIFRTGLMQDYNLSIQGGSEKLRSAVTLNYFNQEGILIESGFERYSLRANFDYNISDRFKVGSSTTLSYTDQEVFPTNNFANGIFNIALMVPPVIPPDGAITGAPLYYSDALDNPVARARDLENTLNTIRGLTTVFGEYEIVPGLTYKLNVGADLILSNSNRWDPEYQRGLAINPDADAWNRRTQDISWLIENTLTYNKTFAEKHNVTVLAGQTAQRSEFSALTGSGSDFLNNDLRAISLSNSELRNASGGGTRWALASYIGRVNYNYDGRYLLSASVRYDGSSRFGSATRWGTFPSFSAGWNIAEESFFDVPFISDLKLRGSWGQLGSDRIGNFNYLTTFNAGTEYTLGAANGGPVPGVSLGRLGNPNLRWETSTQTDIGLDAAFLDGRVTLIADYFIKETTDLLVNVPIPNSSGVPSNPTVNAGSVRNSGFELALGYRDNVGDFGYNVNLNFATINNEVLSIGDGQPIVAGTGSDRFDQTRTEVGQPTGYFFGYIVDGIYQDDAQVAEVTDFRNPEPGDFIFRDVNGVDADGNIVPGPDGVVDINDRTFIGSPIPDFTYGLNVSLNWKNLDMNVFFQGVQGNEIYNIFRQQTWQIPYFNGSGVTNSVREVYTQRWTGPGTSNTVPEVDYNDVNNYPFSSDFYVEDGSFTRLRNLQIGYSLPTQVSQSIGITNARFYVGAQNLFTITDYSGFDPEIGDRNQSPLLSGIDSGNYPLPRTYRLGLQVTF
jgi:TonB-linked SusC/RagA family outer membrane protein